MTQLGQLMRCAVPTSSALVVAAACQLHLCVCQCCNNYSWLNSGSYLGLLSVVNSNNIFCPSDSKLQSKLHAGCCLTWPTLNGLVLK